MTRDEAAELLRECVIVLGAGGSINPGRGSGKYSKAMQVAVRELSRAAPPASAPAVPAARHHGYGCPEDGEPLTGPCDHCCEHGRVARVAGPCPKCAAPPAVSAPPVTPEMPTLEAGDRIDWECEGATGSEVLTAYVAAGYWLKWRHCITSIERAGVVIWRKAEAP
jgi:hypothetical protein